MQDSEKPNQQPAPRNTLKLKSPIVKTPAAPPAAPVQKPKPPLAKTRDPASWADVHKDRMQAEMDALSQLPAARGNRPK